MPKYGPSKKEHQFRLGVSLLGLCMVGVGLWRMEKIGPGAFDALGLGGAFLLGSAVWSGWKLFKRDFGED